jgi:hypothetical protein
MMMNIGATTPVMKDTTPILTGMPGMRFEERIALQSVHVKSQYLQERKLESAVERKTVAAMVKDEEIRLNLDALF